MEGVINFPLLNLTIDALSLSANLVKTTVLEKPLLRGQNSTKLDPPRIELG